MSYLLVDGYNLLGSVKRKMEKERAELIEKLSRYCTERAHQMILVFDGWKNGPPEETKMKIGRMTVIYSRLHEKADTVIKRILSQRQRSWIVVSSDRELIKSALQFGCIPLRADEFNHALHSILTTSQDSDFCSIDEDAQAEKMKKGNPKRLSKREKLKLRALKKL